MKIAKAHFHLKKKKKSSFKKSMPIKKIISQTVKKKAFILFQSQKAKV